MQNIPSAICALIICTFTVSSISAQQDTIELNLDLNEIKSSLVGASNILSTGSNRSNKQLEVPQLDGQISSYYVYETINMEEPLYSQFPEIRSYILINKDDPRRRGRLSTGADHVNIMTKDSNGYEFITPTKDRKKYQMYKGNFDSSQMTCGTDEILEKKQIEESQNRSSQSSFTNGTQLRTYRIAIAATGEFYNAQGGTDASVLAKINGYLNLLNDIYEDELSVHFNLIGNNTDILFDDASTDGLDPSNGNTQIASSQAVINSTIGAANYDIGHTFYTSPGGCCSGSGIAGVGILCETNNKARGWTGANATASDALWMGLWAHEIGHQFGAFHTMYGTVGNCVQRTAGNGYEPGSGNSLMSYEGICTSHNITPEVSTIYFHNHSLDQMITEMNSKSCQTTTATGNNIPVTSAPNNKTIPRGTPFELIGTASDGNSDAVIYNWEEYDTDNNSYPQNAAAGNPNAAANSTTAPLFRSFDPSTEGHTRVFPTTSDIVNNTQTQGEILPNVSRAMKFRLTSRDFRNGGGAVSCDQVNLTVDASMGPFNVNSQASATNWTANGSSTATVTWNVAGTDALCSDVDILFTTDRGNTFPFSIATNIANDGSHTFIIPSFPTTVGRVKVKCSDNYFFDINLGDITLSSTCDAVSTTFSPDADIIAIAGSSALNLSLTPDFGNVIGNINGTLNTTDPNSTLTANSGGGCAQFSNVTNFDEYPFQVGSSGTYTFSRSGNFNIVMTLYEGPFIPGSPCTNFIKSSFTNGSNNSSNLAEALSAGLEYTLVVGSFGTNSPNLPSSYTISNSGGTVYDGTPPPPAATFSYTYIAVNNASDNIAAVNANSNFTGLSAGEYTVYGISYENNANINSYIGNSFSSFQNDASTLVICAAISLNDIILTIQGSGNCPPNFSGNDALDGTASGTQDFETDGAIESTQIINANANIDYDSGTSILLEAPFEVKANANFNAFIDGCDGAQIQDGQIENK